MAGGRGGTGGRGFDVARARRLLLVLAVLHVVPGSVVPGAGPGASPEGSTAPAASAAAPSAPAAAVVTDPAGGTTPDPPPAGGGALAAAPAPAAADPAAEAAATAPAPGSAASRLGDALDAALGSVGGCLLVTAGGTELYSRGGDDPVTPASTQKLLVAAAALSRLGPDFRFETVVRAAAPPTDGVVEGVVLVGGGDPVLASPQYAGYRAASARTRSAPVTPLVWLAEELVAAGVREVRGGIAGDDGRHDRARYLPSWKPSYRSEAEVGPLGALMVDGGLDAWRPRPVATADPVAHATSALARLLSERGVGVGAAGEPGPAAGSGVVLARVRSAPLSELVAAMLSASDNVIAELVTRELHVHAGGSGTTAGGVAVIVEEAARLGLPVDGLSLVDGSGLDRGNRATCRTLLGVLGLAGRPRLGAVVGGLAVAGRSGTLANRYAGTPLEGRLMAKTGWISGVAGMVGRVEVGAPVDFAFVGNGEFGWPTAKAMQDRLVSLLGEYRPDG